jgi:membrane-bound lytic murein transglycosylase MltF
VKTLLALMLMALIVAVASATPPITPPEGVRPSIPARSVLYRIKLEREVAAQFGNLDATARIAAQVHQESLWNPTAASAYAQGLTQFTPSTAEWIPSVCPGLGPPDVWDPNWSMRAAVCYDRWLLRRVAGADDCQRWAFALSAYNGGLTWVNRDKALAEQHGRDPLFWFDHVEHHSRRARWAITENRGYVRRILHTLEPLYLAAGWPGRSVCA